MESEPSLVSSYGDLLLQTNRVFLQLVKREYVGHFPSAPAELCIMECDASTQYPEMFCL